MAGVILQVIRSITILEYIDIVVGITDQDIVAGATLYGINSRRAQYYVVTAAADQGIRFRYRGSRVDPVLTLIQQVIASAAVDIIVTGSTEYTVITIFAIDVVIPAIGVDGVVAITAVDSIVSVSCHDDIIAAVTVNSCIYSAWDTGRIQDNCFRTVLAINYDILYVAECK